MNPMYDYALDKIKHFSNFNLAIIGPVGTGKSFAALRIAKDLDPSFPMDASRVVFSVKDFYSLVEERLENKIGPGSAVVLDEASTDLSSGKHYMDNQIQTMRKVLHTFRKFQLVTILTFPISMGKLSSQVRDCFDVVCDMRSINFKENYSIAMPHLIQVNSYSGKDYRHSFKDFENEEEVTMASLRVFLPPEELVAAYNKKQDAFKRKILKEAKQFEERTTVDGRRKELGLKYYYDEILKEPILFLNQKQNSFSPASIMVRFGIPEKPARAVSLALNNDWSNGVISVKK